MIKLVAIPLFIFLFLFVFQAQAYSSTIFNTTWSSSFSEASMVRCSNLTGTAYCYIFYRNGIERVNSTGSMTGSCTTGLDLLTTSGAIVNTTDAYQGNAGFLSFNLSDMSGSCSYLPAVGSLSLAPYGGFGVGYNNETVYYPKLGQIRFKDNTTVYATGYWGVFNSMSMPNMSDNTTTYFWNSSITDIYKYSGGVYSASFPSINDIYGIGYSSDFDMMKEADGFTYIYIAERLGSSNRFYKANISAIEDSSYYNCNTTITDGTTCIDSTNYQTINQCNTTYGSCPANSLCVQITPVLNTSNDLIENYTSCYIRTTGGLDIRCSNVCFNGIIIFSNCVDAGCKKCPSTLTPTITYGGVEGYFTNTYYSNKGSLNVAGYTIACMNQYTGEEVYSVNQTGSQTTVLNILEQSGNDITMTNQTTETPTTPDISAEPSGSFALFVGRLVGISDLPIAQNITALLISLIVGVALTVALAYYDVSESGMVFIFTELIMLIFFTLAGWFPSWFIVVLIVIASLGIASKIGALGGP